MEKAQVERIVDEVVEGWTEGDHPRDKDGKFRGREGSWKANHEANSAQRKAEASGLKKDYEKARDKHSEAAELYRKEGDTNFYRYHAARTSAMHRKSLNAK